MGTMLFQEIADSICHDLLSGTLTKELPSVKKLAKIYDVNPNTIQRALQVLSFEKFLVEKEEEYALNEDEDVLHRKRLSITEEKVSALFAELESLGVSKKEIRKEVMRKGQNNGT